MPVESYKRFIVEVKTREKFRHNDPCVHNEISLSKTK